jgi:hypothetical protein
MTSDPVTSSTPKIPPAVQPGDLDVIDEPTPLDHIAGQVDAYRHLDRQVKELTEMRDRVRDVIVQALHDHTTGTVNGRTAVRHTAYVQRRLSPTLVKKRFTDDELTDCYAVSHVRKFTLVQ